MVAFHCKNIISLNHECNKYFASTDEIKIRSKFIIESMNGVYLFTVQQYGT